MKQYTVEKPSRVRTKFDREADYNMFNGGKIFLWYPFYIYIC